MKKLLLILFISSSIFAQRFIPIPSINRTTPVFGSAGIGSVEQGTTLNDSVSIINVGQSFKIDSINAVSALTSITFDSTAIDGTSYVKFTCDISTVGLFTDGLIVYSNLRTSPDTIDVNYSVFDSSYATLQAGTLAISDSLDGITLTMTGSSQPRWSKYIIERSTDAVTFTELASSISNAYTDNTNVEAVEYFYRFKNKSIDGTVSSYSNIDSTIGFTGADWIKIYIDSSAAGGGDGSYATPHNEIADITLDTLSQKTKVFLKGGYYYTDIISLDGVHGSSNSLIYFESYGSTIKPILGVPPLFSTAQRIFMTGASYIYFKNIAINSERWIDADESAGELIQHITLDGMDMYSTSASPEGAFLIRFDYNGDIYLTIKNCTMIGWELDGSEADLLYIGGSNYGVIQDNYFSKIPHALIVPRFNSKWLIRGNRFQNTYQHTIHMDREANEIVVDNNFFERAGTGKYYDGIYTAYGNHGGIYIHAENTIFRNNIVKKHGGMRNQAGKTSWLPAVRLTATTLDNEADNPVRNRVYNNVFYDNYTTALRLGSAGLGNQSKDNQVFNNLFIKNGIDSADWALSYYGTSYADDMTNDSLHIHIQDDNSAMEDNVVEYNYFDSDSAIWVHGGSWYNANTTAISGITFNNNANESITLNSPDDSSTSQLDWMDDLKYSFTPNSGTSPSINAGRHIAEVTQDGNSTTIYVDDPFVFFTGWNWVDGDSIVISTAGASPSYRYTRVTARDTTNNYITVNSAVEVSEGDYIDIINPYHGMFSGTTNDIGAFEYEQYTPLAPSIIASNVTPISTDSAKIVLTFRTNYSPTIARIITDDQKDVVDNALMVAGYSSPVPSAFDSSSSNSETYYIKTGLAYNDSLYYKFKLINGVDSIFSETYAYHHQPDTTVSENLGANLVANGGFESGDVSWDDHSTPTSTTIDNVTVIEGSNSMEIVTNDKYQGIRSTAFAVTAGTTYKVYYRLYISAGSVRVKDGQNRLDHTNTYTTTGSWLEGSINVTASLTGNDILIFESMTNSSTIYVDDVKVQEVL